MNTDESVLDFLYFWKRPISPGNLAGQLKMKHTTLNSSLKRLQKKDQVNWKKYGTVSLTEVGKNEAAHLSNHHFIIEKFLTETLDLSAKKAHQEALDLAPAMSCTLIEAICNKLGLSHEEINNRFCQEREYFE